MSLQSTQLHVAAVLLAIAAFSISAPAARAFTQENLSVGGSGNSRFADPDDEVKNFGQGSGYQPFGAGGPVVQFGTGSAPSMSPFSPMNRYQGTNSGPPPEPYARPLGNGN